VIWGADWINVAKDRDRCRAFVNTVMNVRNFIKKNRYFSLSRVNIKFSRKKLHIYNSLYLSLHVSGDDL